MQIILSAIFVYLLIQCFRYISKISIKKSRTSRLGSRVFLRKCHGWLIFDKNQPFRRISLNPLTNLVFHKDTEHKCSKSRDMKAVP